MKINHESKKGQTCSTTQKTKIVLALLKEKETISQIATKYKITSKPIANWKERSIDV
ncbi:MAG: hypothetical protein JJV94_07360 [Sulfurospirillum sp.]|nr:hypothetical protein [Sulfurospirillum sp.]